MLDADRETARAIPERASESTRADALPAGRSNQEHA
jgi:hypothetical protein